MMTGKYRWNLAVSSLVIGVAMGGCASFDMGSRASAKLNAAQLAGDLGSAEQSVNPAAAMSYAAKAADALSAGKSAEAVRWAEGAVLADPHHGGHRALLGQAYMQDGRFSAASVALDEAASLGALSGDAVVALALAKVAEGDGQGAVEFLSDHADGLTASDLGLALSLAGDHDGALYVLGQAVRDESASAQTRQNYSLALAMAGQWAQSRLIAAQDLPLNRVEKRMLEFSTLASAPDKKTQIAGLMGTKLRGDAPMPARLALANFPMLGAEALAAEAVQDQPVAAPEAASAPLYAQADLPEAPVAPAAIAAPVATAAAAPAPVSPAPVSPTVEAMVAALAEEPVRAAPMMAAYEAPAELADVADVQAASLAALFDVPFVAAPVMVEQAMAAKNAHVAPPAPWAAQPSHGAWSVQIASLNSPENAKLAWHDISARHHMAAGLAASTHAARVGQRLHYRLTLDGFASSKEAQNLCNQLKKAGQDCFVRQLSDDVKLLWAVRAQKAVQLAMR